MRNLFIVLCFFWLLACCLHAPQAEIISQETIEKRPRVLPEHNVVDYSLDKCNHIVDDLKRKDCLSKAFDDFLDDAFILEIAEKAEPNK